MCILATSSGDERADSRGVEVGVGVSIGLGSSDGDVMDSRGSCSPKLGEVGAIGGALGANGVTVVPVDGLVVATTGGAIGWLGRMGARTVSTAAKASAMSLGRTIARTISVAEQSGSNDDE